MRGVAAAAVAAGVKKDRNQKKHDTNGQNGKPLRRRWNAILEFDGTPGRMIGAGHVVLAQERFFIEAQVTRDGAHEAAAKNSARQPGPIFIFQGFDKTGADARGLGEFVHGDFAQLTLALQAFTKSSPGHDPEPVLDNPSAAAQRSLTIATAQRPVASATAKRLTRCPLAKYPRGIPQRTIGGAIRRCQTDTKVGSDQWTVIGGRKSGSGRRSCHRGIERNE